MTPTMTTNTTAPAPATAASIGNLRETGTGADTMPLAGSATALASDFETFLRMLTTQARYQDPLEPLDSSQYAAQLAQFSMVEQQVLTNQSLDILRAALGASDIATMAGLVGMEARSAAPALFDGSALTVVPPRLPEAEDALLVVRNEAGSVVNRLPIGTDGAPITWSGQNEVGATVPHGLYSFSVESRVGGEVTRTDPAETYGRVVEAQLQDGAVVLVLGGGQTVASTEVTALRQPVSA